MKLKLASLVLALASLLAAPAHAQSDAALSGASALPVASLVGSASAAAGGLSVVTGALSTAGAVLVVRAVEVGARSTVYVLERASDGARASVEVMHQGARAASLVAGTVVTVSAIGTGILLSAAGEAIAFLPNALGQALLHNERLTN